MPTPASPVTCCSALRHTMRRYLRTARAAACLVLSGPVVVGGTAYGQSGRDLELAVKAAFLYKFAPFVSWPPDAFADDTAPLRLCVAGDDPFGEVLDRSVAGQMVGSRPVEVARVGALQQVADCRILYAAGSADLAVADILRQAAGAPVLTVTDAGSARTGESRGIIHFEIRSGRVRFHIDDAAAAANHLGLSSKLLGMALGVRPRSQPEEGQ